MDSTTMRLITAAEEYLDFHQSRSAPLDVEFMDKINGLVTELRSPLESENELSPGQRDALDASQGFLGEVEIEPSDTRSPGERASLGLSSLG